MVHTDLWSRRWARIRRWRWTRFRTWSWHRRWRRAGARHWRRQRARFWCIRRSRRRSRLRCRARTCLWLICPQCGFVRPIKYWRQTNQRNWKAKS